MGTPTGGVNKSPNTQHLDNRTTEAVGTDTSSVPPKDVPLQQQQQDPQTAAKNSEGMKKAAAEKKGNIEVAAYTMKASLNTAVEKMPKTEDIVADYPINPSTENKLNTHMEARINPKTGIWPVTIEHHIEGYREANSSGLHQRLSELNGRQPLTDFEKQWIAKWDKEDQSTQLTPILQVGEKGVQAYQITQGASGGRITNFYDREGRKLAGPLYPSGRGLVNEGLGPIDYVIGGMAAKKVIGTVVSRVRARAAAKTTETAAKALARSEREAVASGTVKGSSKATSLKDGSGTSVYAKGKATAPQPRASEFTEAEEKAIKTLQESGLSRKEAEDVTRYSRGVPEGVQPLPPYGPNAGRTARRPDWKPPGPGRKKSQ